MSCKKEQITILTDTIKYYEVYLIGKVLTDTMIYIIINIYTMMSF